MTATIIRAEKVNGESFASFGNIIAAGESPMIINNGYAHKHSRLAAIDAAADGKTAMHLFAPRKRTPPIPLTMMERHSQSAQCFVPTGGDDWLAVVADNGGDDKPQNLRAFAVGGDAGLCYGKNIWHFPLLALSAQHFVVADGGDSGDVEEYYFDSIRWLVCESKNSGAILKDNPAQMSENTFMQTFKGIAENAPWVAKAVWHNSTAQAITGCRQMAAAFALAILQDTDDRQLQLIRHHPPLATATKLSAHSASEQNAAGLTNLTAEDNNAFAKLNDDYANKFGFPFVCAVAGLAAADIRAQLQRRINNNAITERAEALYQIFQIIGNRLRQMV